MPTQLTIVFFKWILLHCFCISCGTENAVTDSRFRSRQWFCFCFQMAPDSDLPTVKPARGSFGLIRAHCGYRYNRRTHALGQPSATRTHNTRRDSQLPLLHPHPNTPSMKRNQLNRSQVQDHIKCTFKNINPTQTRKKKTVTTSGNNNKLFGIPNGW